MLQNLQQREGTDSNPLADPRRFDPNSNVWKQSLMARVSNALHSTGFSIQTSDPKYPQPLRGIPLEAVVDHQVWLLYNKGNSDHTSRHTSSRIQTGYQTVEQLFENRKFKLWSQVQQDALDHSGAHLGLVHN